MDVLDLDSDSEVVDPDQVGVRTAPARVGGSRSHSVLYRYLLGPSPRGPRVSPVVPLVLTRVRSVRPVVLIF